jgi:hypothetical protein
MGTSEDNGCRELIQQRDKVACRRTFRSLCRVSHRDPKERRATMLHQTVRLEGIVRGKTIELEEEPGFPEGQRVRIDIRPSEDPRRVEPPPPDEPPA